MSDLIVNKVAESGLITIDLETFFPEQAVKVFDLADHLFMGMILKEKDFREALKTHDWEQYRNELVAVYCSADAVIPMWAYMLVVTYLGPVANEIYQGTDAEFSKQLFLHAIQRIDAASFTDKRLVIKGCGDKAVGEFAYFEITRLLLPYAKSIMYGEPCSTVPVFKRR